MTDVYVVTQEFNSLVEVFSTEILANAFMDSYVADQSTQMSDDSNPECPFHRIMVATDKVEAWNEHFDSEPHLCIRMSPVLIDAHAPKGDTETVEALEVPISKEKQTYTVYADVVISPSAEYDAHSPGEALEMAQDSDDHRVVLCHQCGEFEPSEPDNWRVEDAQGNIVLEENVE